MKYVTTIIMLGLIGAPLLAVPDADIGKPTTSSVISMTALLRVSSTETEAQAKAAVEKMVAPDGALDEAQWNVALPLGLVVSAAAAVRCGRRSNQWFAPFQNNFNNIHQSIRQKIRSPRDRDLFDKYIMTEQQRILKITPCSDFFPGPEMEKLDYFHDKLTGGYR